MLTEKRVEGERPVQKFYEELDRCYAQGDLRAVEQFLQHYAQSGCDRRLELAACNELGSFYRGTSQYQKSVAAFARARTLTVEELGRDHIGYATILNNLAGTYRLMGEYDGAISLFRQAKELYEQLGEQNSFPYASVLNNLALAYQETGEYDRAAKHLEQALERMEKMPQLKQELAITHHNLTALYQKNGEREKAKAHLDRALELFEGCAEGENVHYAAALNSLAGFFYQDGDYAQALATFEKSAEYTRKFFGENVEYAITWQNMSRVYEAMGQREETARCLEQAVEVYKRLLGADHEYTKAAVEELRQIREAGAE